MPARRAALLLLQAALPALALDANTVLPPDRLSTVVPDFTAFGPDGAVNRSAVAYQYAYAAQNGIDVLLLMGTTGEWPSLTVAERMELAEDWCAAKKAYRAVASTKSIPKLMLNIGHASPYEARRMAAHAAGLVGIEALLVSPPGLPYHAPTLELLIGSLQIALEPAPALPAFYYHYLDLYGDSFKMKDLLEAARDSGRLSTLVGCKFAGAAISQVDVLEASQVEPSRFATFVTADKFAEMASLRPGPRGLIILTWEGELIRSAFAAIEANDTAAFTKAFARLESWREIAGAFNVQGANYQVTGIKAVPQLAGLNLGGSRLPLPSVSAAQVAQLKAAMVKAKMMPPPLLP